MFVEPGDNPTLDVQSILSPTVLGVTQALPIPTPCGGGAANAKGSAAPETEPITIMLIIPNTNTELSLLFILAC